MINFLTDEIFKEERRKKINFLLQMILVLIMAFVSHSTLKLYLDNKMLDYKKGLVNNKIRLIDQEINQLKEVETKVESVKEEIVTRRQRVLAMVSTKDILEELSLLSIEDMNLQSLKLANNRVTIEGISANMETLNLINQKLEDSNLFYNFYFDKINKEEQYISFVIKGELKKGV